MPFWRSCQKIDLMNVDRRAKRVDWFLNNTGRGFFWNAYQIVAESVRSIVIFFEMRTDQIVNKSVKSVFFRESCLMICFSYSHLADLWVLIGVFSRVVPAVSLISVETVTVI